MPKLKRKLEVFKNSVLSESSSEAQRIIDELTARKKDAVQRLESDLNEEIRRYKASKQTEISARESRRISAARTSHRHTLLEYREDCAREVFAAVIARIADFAASKEYPQYLTGQLRRAVSQLGYGFAAEVYLRPEDMYLKQHLLESVSGVSLRFEEGAFTYGGLRLVCPSRGLRVDMSFDSAIADIVGHFSEIAGMNMDQG